MNDTTRTTLTRLAQQVVLSLEQPESGGRRLSEYFVEPRLETPDGVFVSASSVFEHAPRMILLGGAGTGKTTLLRFRALQAARAFIDDENQSRCPLLVAARELHNLPQDFSLETIVSTSLASALGLTPEILESLLEQGVLELLVDGLDEVAPTDRLGITQRLSDVFRRYPNAPAMVASRPAALSVSFPGFSVYSLPGFDQSQLRSLIDLITTTRPAEGQRFYDTILQSRQLSDLAKSPLMIHLLWSVFEGRGTVPTNPAFLYSDFTDYLLSTWERAKDIGQRSGITLQEKRTVLENLALQLVERSQMNFDMRAIDAAIDNVVPTVAIQRNEIVGELLSSGLLREDAAGLFSFVHKSFVEYFAARAIGAMPQEAIRFLDAQEADELLVFACGLMDDVAPLIEAAIQRRRVVLAAKCISQGRTRNNELKNYVVREFTREVGQTFVDLLARSGARANQDAHTRTSIELLHLLDSACDSRLANHERGARFEDFAVGFFSQVFKVVSRDLHTENGELDAVVEIIRSDPFWLEFGGDALVECKNWTSNVPIKEVGAFLNKVNQGRVKLAFFISFSGFTEDALRTLRNHAANVTAPLVVPLSGESIKNALMTGVILEEFFKDAIRSMKYLRKY